ncbi:EDS1 (YBR033W) and RGT1 (YKL038W) [Zygosaccharomyces parabailii]|nr:EDS1 (YBR033W) and RGT1 (YKL038W) [Zygosaccharomyces parabailii]CDH11683.1 related to Glucose transport transcription regulator RGT1 [Zygosaccharomyces bailii ISA1307]
MTSTNDSGVPKGTGDTTAAMIKSRSNSSEYASGSNNMQVGEVETHSSMGSNSGGAGGVSSSATKRRTKASRACDQCRKRKIRCDYGDEKGVCVSCSKNGEFCLFERIPLKRGPSKGAVRGHSISRSFSGDSNPNSNNNNNNNSSSSGSSNVLNNNNNNINNINNDNDKNAGGGVSSPSSRQGSVLLPPLAPLAQYLSQPAPNVNQQQFWKVPYHGQGQRRGSIDSLSSDISFKSINTPQEQMMYTAFSVGHPLQSPATVSLNNGPADVGHWTFRGSSGDDTEGSRRRSGSYPPSLRKTSTNQLQPQLQQPQANPYSQFSQLQQQQQQYKQQSTSTFGQYGANGFPSRQGSIVSDGVSPSAPALYQGNNGGQAAAGRPMQWPKIQDQTLFTPIRPNKEHEGSVGSPSQKSGKRRRTNSFVKEKGKQQGVAEELTVGSSDRSPESSIVSPAGFVYGQIPEVRLIDTYYEFIHAGFPIIPLKKETVTNEILLVNTQPISTIHEINNYVILWFRNSLELLIRISLKRKSGHFYDNLIYNRDRDFGTETGGDTIEENVEIQNVFVTALNECLQKIVDIHPSFRENRNEISPKIKVIYLSTFILLNYILAVLGYDNSFVLGMSVTIFKDFKIYELLLYDDDDSEGEVNAVTTEVNPNLSTVDPQGSISSNTQNEEQANESPRQKEYSIMFKRLYVLLIIFDSLQCCAYGGPKLLNVPIEGACERFFESISNSDSKWVVDENSVRMNSISQSIKFGELLSEFSMNRRSICDVSCKHLIWAPSAYFVNHKEGQDGFNSLGLLFSNLLLSKQAFINELLSLEDLRSGEVRSADVELCTRLTDLLRSLTSAILDVLTVMMRTNPKNCIDYNYRPERSLEEERDSAVTPAQNPVGAKHVASRSPSSMPNTSAGNDFYQKLLGLQGDGDSNFSNFLRGVISPFCIPMLREIRNITELIKHMPATLIGVVMTCAGMNQNLSSEETLAANIKSQDLVVKLSNCMNDMMQITSLLNMIKPAKLFDQENDATRLPKTQSGRSTMQRLYHFKNGMSKREDAEQMRQQAGGGDESTLRRFVVIGWKLLDDLELGWF